MEDFVKLIEKIGFKEEYNPEYKYLYKNGLWRIDIIKEEFWQLTYSDHNPNPLDRVEVTHLNIPFDDRRILKKYFISEIRDIKLDILFDEQKSLAQRVKELGI